MTGGSSHHRDGLEGHDRAVLRGGDGAVSAPSDRCCHLRGGQGARHSQCCNPGRQPWYRGPRASKARVLAAVVPAVKQPPCGVGAFVCLRMCTCLTYTASGHLMQQSIGYSLAWNLHAELQHSYEHGTVPQFGTWLCACAVCKRASASNVSMLLGAGRHGLPYPRQLWR